MKLEAGKFHEAISQLLGSRLQPMTGPDKDLNLLACTEIYMTVFDTLVELVTEASIPISNESVNYLAQQYYDGIEVRGAHGTCGLDPEIFTQRAKLEEIETKELALLAVMLNGTDFAFPVIAEIKKRG